MWVCLFIVWYPPLSSVDFTIYTPGIGTLSYTASSPIWGEFSICALCCSYSQSLQLSFLVPLVTHHCWVDRGGMLWEACPTPLHMVVGVAKFYHFCESCNRTTSPVLICSTCLRNVEVFSSQGLMPTIFWNVLFTAYNFLGWICF